MGSVRGRLVELLPMRTSDNLRIPIVSGSIMELMLISHLQNQTSPPGTIDMIVEIKDLLMPLVM